MNYAPILISIYDRKKHLIRLIKSLQKNVEAKETDLFIVSDAAYTHGHKQIVSDVRDYVKQIDGFKNVELIAREENMGPHNSILAAINYVFEKNDRLIFLEDDNFVSENFLAYLNEGLEFYKNHYSILSISGYNYPISIKNPSSKRSYFFPAYSAWGVGMWRERWKAINQEINFYKIGIEVKKERKQIKKKLGENAYGSISNMCRRQVYLGDVIWRYHCYKNNMVSVFPEISKVRNHGHDGLGIHGGVTDRFVNQKIDDNSKIFHFENEIIYNDEIYKSVLKYFSVPLYKKAKSFLKQVYLKIKK